MKIGIITYHAAYNFGSMLQAYATQEALRKLGHEVVVLNYRMPSQKRFYKEYRTEYGKLNFLQDILQFPMHKEKKIRKNRYEEFLNKFFVLSDEFNEPEEMKAYCEDLDVIISGSDQIWNSKSCEFVNCDVRYMRPYLLDGFEGKKISYASSIGHMDDVTLKWITPFIEKFNYISVREQTSKDRLGQLIEKPIERVLDPTFLLNREEWINRLGLKREESTSYLLFYSLKRFNGNRILKDVINFARKKNLAVKYVMPFSYYPDVGNDVDNCESYGPIEFMNAIYNADLVITDSYHGTILSLNLNRNVYSLCYENGAEFRKTEILERMRLEDRIVGSVGDIMMNNVIEFDLVNERIDTERTESYEYLVKSINA